jgi:hypothetical protein
MAILSPYDEAAERAEHTRAGERIPGPPGPGLLVLWLGWMVVAAIMAMIGGAVFLGILEAVASR